MTFAEWSKQKKKKEQENEASHITNPSGAKTSGKKQSFAEWSNQKRDDEAGRTIEGWDKSATLLVEQMNRHFSTGGTTTDEPYLRINSRAHSLLDEYEVWRGLYLSQGDHETVSHIDSVAEALNGMLKGAETNFNRSFLGKKYEDITENLNKYRAKISEGTSLSKAERDEYTKLAQEYITVGDKLFTKENGFTNEQMQDWYSNQLQVAEGSASVHDAYRSQFGEGNWDKWGHYIDAEDFEEYAAKGADLGNPSWEGSRATLDLFGWKPFGEGETVNNLVTFAEANASRAYAESAGALMNGGRTDDLTALVNAINTGMTDDEKRLYHYLVGKELTAEADGLIRHVFSRVTAESGASIAKAINDIDIPVLEELALITAGAATGVDQFFRGVEQRFSGDQILPSTGQYISAYINESEDTAQYQKYLFNASSTVGNMAPSILAGSLLGPNAGTASMWLSVSGNAYGDALSKGYSKGAAQVYGALVGASEAGLQRLLGGISKLGGINTTGLAGRIAAIDNSLLRIAGQLGLSVGSEIIEEELQLFLEPAFEAIIFDTEYNVPKWDEMIETAIITALSTGALEGPGTVYRGVSQTMADRRSGKAIMDAEGGVPALKALAMDTVGAMDTAGVLDANLTNKITDRVEAIPDTAATGDGVISKLVAWGKNRANAVKVGKLARETATANKLANTGVNKADIVKSLSRNDFGDEEAKKIADALVTAYNGQELSKDQQKLLKSVEKNQAVQNAVSRILENAKSTVGQRQDNVRAFYDDVDAGRIAKKYGVSVDVAKKVMASFEKGEATSVTAPTVKVSKDGKTLDKNGNEIVIEGVESTDGGKLILKTKDGTIDSSDVVYANDSDALVYETVAKMGASPASAWTMIKSFNEADGVSALEYATSAPLAYLYGKLGYEKGVFEGGKPRLNLSATQSATVYQMGRTDAEASVKTTAQTSTESTITEKNAGKEIIYEGFKYDEKAANDVQRASIKAIEVINKMSSLEIHVFKSYKKNGKFYAVINGKERIAPNGYFKDGNKIYIDFNAGRDGRGTMLFTIAHEIGHHIADVNAADFKAISDFLFAHYGPDAPIYNEIQKKKAIVIESYKRDGKAIPDAVQLEKEAQEELVCDMCSRLLADQYAYDKLMELKQENLNAFQKLGQAIKKVLDKLAELIGIYNTQVTDFAMAASKENFGEEAFRQLQDLYIKAFVQADANFQAAEKNTTEDGGVKEQARPSIKNPDQLDPRTVTRADVVTLLQMVERGEIYGDTYFPVRINTPAKLIYWAYEKLGDVIDNNPIAMSADKAYNAMNRQGETDKGRPNRLSVEELVLMFDAMKDPRYIVYQESNGRYVEVVEFNTESGDTAFAIIEIGNAKDAPYMNGFEGGLYNILVTTFPPKSSAKLRELLKTKGNRVIYDKMKDAPQRTSSSTVPSVLNDASFFDDTILDSGNVVKSESTEALDIEVDTKTESVAPKVMNSERTWTESDYVQEREQAAKEISKAIGVSVKKAKAYIDSVNSIAKMIAEDRVRLDYFSSPGRSSFVGNVEYGGSFDFSTLCKKRRLLTGTFTAIQKALPNTALTANEILDIRNRMKEAGLEVSCGLCYVEGSRANMGQFAKEFLKLYKQYYPDAWQPNMADVNTPDGIEWVRINHPEAYEQYEYFWNHYGTLKPGDKNLFASQQKPKLYQLHTEYKGEILEKFNDDDNVEEKNLNGGIRLQSFSDFEIVHLIDTMQIIMDMSRVGLAGQAYTKVPDFAWALGDTGLKINLSLIAKGVDENGKLIFDDVEGMPIDEAMKLRDRYSKNVGTILVAFNDAQLLAAMADDRVDFIIPFHRSQWKKSQYEAMGLPAKTKDYTYMQNEKYIKPQFHEYRGRMVKDKATNYMPNEYWDFSKSGKENAEAYLEMCARNNKRPKFYKLLQNNGDGSYSLKADGSTDGYWKLLIDFKMYDNSGKGSPQMPVKPDFNMDEATRMMDEYSGGHSNFPVAQGIVDDFVSEYKDSHKGAMYSERTDSTMSDRAKEILASAKPKRIGNEEKGYTNIETVQELFNELNADKDIQVLAERVFKVARDDHYGYYGYSYPGELKSHIRLSVDFVGKGGIPNGVAGQFRKDTIWGHIVFSYDYFMDDSIAPQRKASTILHEVIHAITCSHIESGYMWMQAKHGSYADPLQLTDFDGVDDRIKAGIEIIDVFEQVRSASKKDLYGQLTAYEMVAEMANVEFRNFLKKQNLWTRIVDAIKRIFGIPNTTAYDAVSDALERILVATTNDADAQRAKIEARKSNRMFSERTEDSVSNRSLLANAFEGVVKNDIERKKIQEYKDKIDQIDAQERKLEELNKQIKELSFGKGPRDTKKIRELRDEATKTANRISNLDKILLRLEASAPLQKVLTREKKKAYDRAVKKGKETLANYRESAARSQMRTKIKNFKKKMEAKLLRPTDRQFVPIDLISAMVEVCSIIDTDTDLYKADGSINKAQEQREKTKEKLQNLKDEYEKLKTHSDPIYAGEFDDMVYSYLTDLRDKFKGKSLSEMSLDEMAEMYEILRGIDETLADARKLIGWGDAESVYEAGDSIVAEQREITKDRKNGKRNAYKKFRDSGNNLSLSPVRNVERMSDYNKDSYLLKLFKKFEQGIRKKNKFVMDAYKSFEKLTSGKEYEDAMYKETGKQYEDVNGRKFSLSKMQMMQAILSWERETANHKNHIASGGFSFADLDMLRKGKLKDAISEEYSHRVPAAVDMVADFQELLKDDKWCQDYMAAARKFFNETAKDAINETSIALKHRIIAKEKSYIPFEVDKNFVVREISAEDNIQQTINSYGMLKETKDGAPQPLIITGLNNILDRHIDQVGNVYGLAVEVRNFNKVWNVRAIDDTGSDPTVKTAIQRNWGVEGVKHIEQAVQDIQGQRVRERSWLYDKVKSGYIGATFLLNLSVVTKQIGSLFSSTSMLRWRDPVSMIGNLVYTMANSKKISAEVDKYTATAWMRRQGMSDAELYTLMTQAKKPGLVRLMNKAPAAINPTKWITAMDHAVALSLWRYCKIDTAKRTGLEGEELLKATARFYDEVIENTQSMTDVLHRPEIQKRGDIVSEAFAMFKTDLYQMAGQLKATTGRFMADKSGENAKALGRTLYSIAMGAVWGQLMTTLFALIRYKVKPYRDDEDEELTVESWLTRQGFGLTGDLMGYVFPVVGSEAVGFFENIKYGETDEIVDSVALTAINDLYDCIIAVGTAINEGEWPELTEMRKLTSKVLQVFGIPANNILRTWDAIELHARDIANGEFLSFEAGVDRSPKHHIHRIIEAVDEGKTDVAMGLFEEALEELATKKAEGGEYGEDELKEAKSDIKSALGTKYKDGEVSEQTATKIMADLLGMDEDDIYWTFDQWDYAKETGSSDDYAKFGEFFTAVETGKNLKAVIKQYTDNGVSTDSLVSQITNHYKPQYIEMSKPERASINGYLRNAMVCCGKTEEYANAKLQNWDLLADYPEYRVLSDSQAKKYHESVKSSGVSVSVYDNYCQAKEGYTKKDDILRVINSMAITKAQKDALYLAEGCAKSNLSEAPWH